MFLRHATCTHCVPIFEFAHHYKGSCQGQSCDSDRLPWRYFRNHQSCKPFVEFVCQPLFDQCLSILSLWNQRRHATVMHVFCPLVLPMSQNHGTIFTNLSDLFALFLLLLYGHDSIPIGLPMSSLGVWSEIGVRLGVFFKDILYGFEVIGC